MKAWQRLKAWYAERGKRWTIAGDFGGPLIVYTPFGAFQIPAAYKYDRFTAVYNTPYPRMWAASAAHDWICDELNAERVVCDLDGAPIITTREQGDAAFLYLMVEAVRVILLDDLQAAKSTLTAEGYSEAIKAACAEAYGLMRRTARYHKGVRGYARLAGLR